MSVWNEERRNAGLRRISAATNLQISISMAEHDLVASLLARGPCMRAMNPAGFATARSFKPFKGPHRIPRCTASQKLEPVRWMEVPDRPLRGISGRRHRL